MHKFPVIGLTLDAEEPGGYSKFPWYALRQNYFSSVREAGGLPLGAVLVLVFDSAAQALAAPGPVTARWTGLGAVSAELR